MKQIIVAAAFVVFSCQAVAESNPLSLLKGLGSALGEQNQDQPKSPSGNKDKIGTGVGAALGGLLGNRLGKGHKDRKLATIAGAALGAFIGNKIGKEMNAKDKELYEVALAESFKKNVGESNDWKNPETGNRGAIEVVNAYKESDQLCKKVDSVITTGSGNVDKQTITGCQDKDGGWTLVGG